MTLPLEPFKPPPPSPSAARHADVQTLPACGVLDKTEDGKIQFAYDAGHVDFMVMAG